MCCKCGKKCTVPFCSKVPYGSRCHFANLKSPRMHTELHATSVWVNRTTTAVIHSSHKADYWYTKSWNTEDLVNCLSETNAQVLLFIASPMLSVLVAVCNQDKIWYLSVHPMQSYLTAKRNRKLIWLHVSESEVCLGHQMYQDWQWSWSLSLIFFG